MSRRRTVAAVAVLAAGGLLAVGLAVRSHLGGDLVRVVSEPVGVMGTQCRLQAVVPRGEVQAARSALREAERALRGVETRMSTYLELSELSRLNAAPAGQVVKLSPDTLAVLRLARALHGETQRAFDVTCLPVFRLWGRAGRAGRLPTDEELSAARQVCGWERFELLAGGVRKTSDPAGIGLGGIAKGYAIDRASEALRAAGLRGGLVDVGGDIRCFGSSPRGGPWRVAVQDPFDVGGGGYFGTLELTDLAVCTSGNYRRYAEIAGKRYSHIIDPRTGRPVDVAPSVTVVAPSAAVADAWATALSVLGPAGLARLPPGGGIEAMVVEGGPTDYRVHQTAGFGRLLVEPVPPCPAGAGGGSAGTGRAPSTSSAKRSSAGP